MIIEVGIRFVAFGRVRGQIHRYSAVAHFFCPLQLFWKSPFNVVDLILTLFCAITLLAITLVGCGATSKAEEVFDTLLLVARNVLQFGRLAAVMRQSGQSIFSRPKPIDLSKTGRSRPLDIDIEDDEWPAAPLPHGTSFHDDEPETPFTSTSVVFDASDRPEPAQNPWTARTENRDQTDTWASLG